MIFFYVLPVCLRGDKTSSPCTTLLHRTADGKYRDFDVSRSPRALGMFFRAGGGGGGFRERKANTTDDSGSAPKRGSDPDKRRRVDDRCARRPGREDDGGGGDEDALREDRSAGRVVDD